MSQDVSSVCGDRVPPVVRIVTWNLWGRFGAWRDRAEAIAAVLRAARPDICGLQEVWSANGAKLAERLAEELGMEWLAEGTYEARAIGACPQRHRTGNAVLSRWPITKRLEQRLPTARGDAVNRWALLTTIATPDGELPFLTTQLSSPPSESATRCMQVKALVDLVAGREQAAFPPVVTGDMNAEPDSDEIRLLGGSKTAPARAGFVLVDAWRYCDQDAIPWTWDRENPHVRATEEPSARIDYVFVGPPRRGRRGRVRLIRRIGDKPVDGVWPSDHAGLLVELGTAGRPFS